MANNAPPPLNVRFVRMIEGGRAAAPDNPTIIMEYDAGQVYRLDASTAESFRRRGIAQLGRVIETVVSDENGAQTIEFEFVPDGQDVPVLATAPVVNKPAPIPIATQAVPPAASQPVDPSPPGSKPDQPGSDTAEKGDDTSRKAKRGGFKATDTEPKRTPQ